MYRHIHDVATLIDDADGLLIGVSHRHTHESAELSYSEVHMHYVVAGCHLLQFLHGESHLSCACGVAPQTVLVETVEYLVVGEEAYFQRIVGKALVEGLINGCKRQRISYRDIFAKSIMRSLIATSEAQFVAVEDVAKTSCLLLAVGKDVEAVALEDVVFERIGEQFEILVEQRLLAYVEMQCDIGRERW